MRRSILLAVAFSIAAVACQPTSTEFTEEQKAEIAAEVNAIHAEFWDAWRETDVTRGLSYFRNSPEITFAGEGQLTHGFAANSESARSSFANVASQTITFTESRATVLAPDVVNVMEQGTYAVTDTAGVMGPELVFAYTSIWVHQNGEWKLHFTHYSTPTPENP